VVARRRVLSVQSATTILELLRMPVNCSLELMETGPCCDMVALGWVRDCLDQRSGCDVRGQGRGRVEVEFVSRQGSFGASGRSRRGMSAN
jgi:hypothetical protein